MQVSSISKKLKSLFPSLSDAWIRHLEEDGVIISAQQNQNDFGDTQGIYCLIILDGILLVEKEESSLLLQEGDVFGLRETLFSTDINGAKSINDDSDLGQHEIKLRSMSNQTLFIKIKGKTVLNNMESEPQLREDWLHVLNQSFERQLTYGLDLYQLDTVDRIRYLIKKIKQYADERLELPVKQIQMLTGVSRSSIYRCLKALEGEDYFVFCNKGQICIDSQKEVD